MKTPKDENFYNVPQPIIRPVDEYLLTHKYTDKDLQDFAEWCSLNGWQYDAVAKVWVHRVKYDPHGSNYLKIQCKIEIGRRKP